MSRFPSFLSILILFFLGSFLSFSYVFFQQKASIQNSLDEEYERKTSLMDKQISQHWFRASTKLGAYYAVEKQLSEFSDDFFESGVIHTATKRIAGFGDTLETRLPKTKKHRGSFEEEGSLFYRVPFPDGKMWVTFALNNKFILRNYPSINTLSFDNVSGEITFSLSFSKVLLNNIREILFLLFSFFLIGLGAVFVTNYYRSSQEEIRTKRDEIRRHDFRNHDLRDASFTLESFIYRVKKYKNSPNRKNREVLDKDIRDLDNFEVVNRRIFIGGKAFPPSFSSFNLNEEIQRVISFIGMKLDLTQLKYNQPDETISVISDLNSFTVLLINLLKNSLREASKDPSRKVDLSFLQTPSGIEVLVSNDGLLDEPRKILEERVSLSGSTGLGLSIVEKHEKQMRTRVTLIATADKVICSFPLRRVVR